MTTTSTIDRTTAADGARADAFADRMLGVLNASSLCLLVSVGHRTGLFDALASSGAVTSEALAQRAALDERYVREWLGGMVTGRVVDYDPVAGTYHLPTEHAASLSRAAAPNNLAAFAQYIAVLGAVEDEIVDCFRRGGGVPYSSYRRFHEVMAEDSGQSVLPVLVDRIVPLAPGLTEALTHGIEVIDVGCGSGRAINVLARAFPRSRFRGIDLSAEALARGRAESERLGLGNTDFQMQDAATWREHAAYDLVTTFDAIHDQADPARVVANIARALRPGGVYLMQEIAGTGHLERDCDHPAGTFLYCISTMHCMTVSLAAGGAGLGAMWGVERAEATLRAAGFDELRIERLPHDFQNCYFVARRS